jgi:hypothetical protein
MDEEIDRLNDQLIAKAIGRLNTKQRAIVGGVLATVQAIDSDTAAVKWLEASRDRIRNELRDARDQ